MARRYSILNSVSASEALGRLASLPSALRQALRGAPSPAPAGAQGGGCLPWVHPGNPTPGGLPTSGVPRRGMASYDPPLPQSEEGAGKPPGGVAGARAAAYLRAAPGRKEGGEVQLENVKEFQVYRWDPESGGRPRMQSYHVDILRCGPMMLDVLGRIKNTLDPTLTYRRSCREGICGSCSMNIDGVNRLACVTPVDPGPLTPCTVTPLPHMFVVKDLVVDLSHQYQQYKSIEPWLKRKSAPPADGREHLQSPGERVRLDGRYECILCFCCTGSCPSWWWGGHQFLGPAALINASRWIMESRDEYTSERLDQLVGPQMYRCHTIMNCAAACPKHLNPGKSIAQMRRMTALKEFTDRPDELAHVNPSNIRGS